MLASEGTEELESSPPPRTLASGTSLIRLRGRYVQDARKFNLGFVLHRAWIQLPTHAQPNNANTTQIGSLYAAVTCRTQEVFALAAQPYCKTPSVKCRARHDNGNRLPAI
jgi:hypothetical protein